MVGKLIKVATMTKTPQRQATVGREKVGLTKKEVERVAEEYRVTPESLKSTSQRSKDPKPKEEKRQKA